MSTKRGDGEGSIRQLPSGKWRGQVMDGYDPDGKRNIVSFTGYTKKDVVSQLRDYWKQRDLGGVPDRNILFDRWADLWYQDYQSQVQPSTYVGYQFTLKALKDYFGKKKIQQIKALDINGFFDYLVRANYSKSYITKARAMLIQIFDAAEANEITSSNPARKAKIRKSMASLDYSGEQSEKDAFTDEECVMLKKRLRDDLLGNSILLMIGTGLRVQEVLALEPEDISPDGSEITISKAIKMVGSVPMLGPPKSERSKRKVPVPMDYRKHAVYLRYYGGKKHVWQSNRESGLYDVGAFRKRYYRALRDIPQVRRLSPHCCRHTYVSQLEAGGVPMEQIARLAGHSHISTTDGYLHVGQDTLADAVKVLNTGIS